MVKTRSGSSSKNLQFLLYLISGFDVMSRPEVFLGGEKGGIVGGDQSNRRDRSNQSYRNYRSYRRGGGGIGGMGRPRVGDRGVG